jgi:hypothetical protein
MRKSDQRKNEMRRLSVPPTTVYTDSIDNIVAFRLKALITRRFSRAQ